ncbi:MAG: glycosyltransferase [Bacteroidales bacterium]|nr:glycosyltransferase [Bacteroidales bacterium]
MRILIVASGNHGQVAPFVTEQAEALRRAGCAVTLFEVKGRGMRSYLRNLKPLKAAIRTFHPDIVHAHYGLCGLLCTLQRRVPVVITYHGSDINLPRARCLSRLAMRRAAFNIFVSRRLMDKVRVNPGKAAVIPCGINLTDFPLNDKSEARQRMGLKLDGHYVLFAGAFGNAVKNAPLAQAACTGLPDVQLLELKGYTRSQVALLMNACDCLLMTSFSEGSPQVTKEALACNLPIVSVDVGDVAELIGGTACGTIVPATPGAIAAALRVQLSSTRRTEGRNLVLARGIDNTSVANSIISHYTQILNTV